MGSNLCIAEVKNAWGHTSAFHMEPYRAQGQLSNGLNFV